MNGPQLLGPQYLDRWPETLYVIGAGGHGKSIASVCAAMDRGISGFFDEDSSRIGQRVCGVQVIASSADLPRHADLMCLSGVADNAERKRSVSDLEWVKWHTLISRHGYLSPFAEVGPGTVVFPGAVVGGDVRLGRHVIVSANCTVGHDSQVEDFCQIAPGVQVAGNTHIGEGALLGIGSSVIPGIKIGAGAIVAAGSVVIRDVAPGTTVAGVPARAKDSSSRA